MNRTPFALAAALLMTGAAAFAQVPAPSPESARSAPGQRMFEQLDTNRDGRVTWDETWNAATTRFTTADADRNGAVTPAEFANMRGPRGQGAQASRPEWQQRMEQRRGAMFRSFDVNGDGQVTLAEMQPFAEARFRAMDVNRDGAVTQDELPQRGHGRNRPGQAVDTSPTR